MTATERSRPWPVCFWNTRGSAAELDVEHALIRHLAEQVDGQSEEETLRLENGSDLIKVITVHKSKGLEYPLMLLPFACSAREIDGTSTTSPMFHDKMELVITLAKGKQAETAQGCANDERIGVAGFGTARKWAGIARDVETLS